MVCIIKIWIPRDFEYAEIILIFHLIDEFDLSLPPNFYLTIKRLKKRLLILPLW